MVIFQIEQAVTVAEGITNSNDSALMLALFVLFGLGFALYKIGKFIFNEHKSDKEGAWKEITKILHTVEKILESIEDGVRILREIREKLK